MKAALTDNIKTTPYWWEVAEPEYLTAAPVPATADVGIVGAGYAGMTAALTLAREGRNVVVFDAMRPGEGASSRNGGICSGNVKYSFETLIKKVGLDQAKTIFKEGIAARQFLINFISNEGIECDLRDVGRFDGANNKRDYEALGRETVLLKKHLDFESTMVSRQEQHTYLGTELYSGGRFRFDIVGVHPAKLYKGILTRAIEAGVTVINRTEVKTIDRQSDNFHLITPYGKTIVKKCIVATNGYTNQVTDWLRRRIISIPSQIIATETLDEKTMNRLMPKQCMVGDTRNLYNYYRPSPDGTRIIFGGRRGADSNDDMTKCRHLYNNMTEVFPELEGIRLTHTWWGYTGYSFDLFPHLSVHDDIYYATGFCGSGVVWAPWLGRKIALTVMGNDKEEKSVFAVRPFPTRSFYNGDPWFLPLVIKWYGLKDRLIYGRRY